LETNLNRMKIALFGNMNNNFFSLSRILIDKGFEVTLFTYSTEPPHFNPVYDTWYYEKYSSLICPLDLGFPQKDIFRSRIIFRKLSKKFDYFIGCDYTPCYFHFAGLKLDMFLPYGSDVYEFPFGRIMAKNFNSFKSLIFFFFDLLISYIQKKGIQNSGIINSTNLFPTFQNARMKLGITYQELGIPLVYLEREPNNIFDLIDKDLATKLSIISTFDFVVASQSRQYWKGVIDKADVDNLKRNDLLIIGFNSFIKKTKINSCLVLFSYGPDVESSKELIRQLKLDANVIWLPKLPRKNILFFLKNFVSIGADQFLSGFFGGTGYEILSQGVALMSTINISKEEYELKTNKKFPPIINVSNPDEICESLVYYSQNNGELEKLKSESKQWYKENFIENLSNIYEKIIIEKNSI